MSFILDALKKSEGERQRQAGPTLLELRITRPRRRYPLWAVIVGVLLATNVIVLLAFVLRRPAAPNAENAAAVPVGPMPAAVVVAPAAAGPAAAVRAAVPPASSATPAAAAAAAAQGSAEQQPALAPAPPDSTNPADAEAAVPAGSVTLQQTKDYSNLPSISQMSGHLPALQLDLLDYSDRASERYALINMHRVQEGDVLPEGARVLAITRDGVALNYGGQNFMLRPGGTAQ